jgi:hypothetical protein
MNIRRPVRVYVTALLIVPGKDIQPQIYMFLIVSNPRCYRNENQSQNTVNTGESKAGNSKGQSLRHNSWNSHSILSYI